ncbi:MAG: prepilin peptidase [Thermanaerothrix sp.]|nr:prepilin peptidase [Thermanaerothrix sp.]
MTVMSVLLGACVASFIETAAHRFVTGRPFWGRERSCCESCGRQLSTGDLIPVLSFLWFRGRCRTCGSYIPKEYLFYEAFTALAFGAAVYVFGPGLKAASCMAMFAFGLFHAVTDRESGYVYDAVSAASFLVGVGLGFLNGGIVGIKWALLGGLGGFLPLAVIVVVSFGRMGIGDAILMGGLGTFLGPIGALLGVYFAVIIGGLWAIVMVLKGRLNRKDPVPFGPFLWVGSFLAFMLKGWIIRSLSDWFAALWF